jgi:hypothetical protein
MSPISARRLLQSFRRSGEVAAHSFWPHAFSVTYRNGSVERYWLADGPARARHIKLTPDDADYRAPPPVLDLFEGDLNARSPFRYVGLSQAAYARASGVEKAVAIQRLVDRTIQIGYQHRLPERPIRDDLAKVAAYAHDNYRDGEIQFLPPVRGRCGYALLGHCFDWSGLPTHGRRSFGHALASPRRLTHVYRRLESMGLKLTNRNAIRYLQQHCLVGPIIPFFGGYMALFRRLGVGGTLLDLHPDTGSKALACARLDIEYLTYPNGSFDDAVADGFADRLGQFGFRHRRAGPTETVDWMIADDNLVNRDAFDERFAAATAVAGRCRRMIVVGSDGVDGLVRRLDPEAAVAARFYPRQPQFHFYVW